jgi:hypothetical protein
MAAQPQSAAAATPRARSFTTLVFVIATLARTAVPTSYAICRP